MSNEIIYNIDNLNGIYNFVMNSVQMRAVAQYFVLSEMALFFT